MNDLQKGIVKAMELKAENVRLRGLVENWLDRLTDGRSRMDRSEIEEWTDEAREALGSVFAPDSESGKT